MAENIETFGTEVTEVTETGIDTLNGEFDADAVEALAAVGIGATVGAVGGYKLGYKNGIKDTIKVANAYLPDDKKLDAGKITEAIKKQKKVKKKPWWKKLEFNLPVTLRKDDDEEEPDTKPEKESESKEKEKETKTE